MAPENEQTLHRWLILKYSVDLIFLLTVKEINPYKNKIEPYILITLLLVDEAVIEAFLKIRKNIDS